jgi:5'-methylthioadenosine nucleosidase
MDAQLAKPSLSDPFSNFFKRSDNETELRNNLLLPASGPIERALIHFAMEDEARPFLVATNARPFLSILPVIKQDAEGAPKIYTYKQGAVEYFISTNGEDSRFGVAQVGTGPSSTAVLLSAIAVKPDLIINAGTAGGFQRSGGEVGDVYLGTGAVFHDHRIPLPSYRDYGRGFYPTLRTSTIQSVLRLKQGIVTTGGSLDCSAEDAAEIAALNGRVKDMEAAEVARVAVTLKIPFLTLKAVTDLVDDSTAKTADQFQSNFELAVAQLTDRLLGLERFLTSNTPPRLELL